jgi:hypothetical protein
MIHDGLYPRTGIENILPQGKVKASLYNCSERKEL